MKTKVKFMEDAYQSMEQQMANKDSIILQAKAYIQEKEEEITSLKQFIEQAKAYITTREQEFKTMMSER